MSKIKKDDNFYLIDGSGYIFRAYYALPPLTRKAMAYLSEPLVDFVICFLNF